MCNQTNIRTTIRSLKKEKKKWLDENFTAADLKRKFNFRNSEIEKIKATEGYGKKRYLRQDILKFVTGNKEKFELFIALDTKQASFIPPFDKNKQGKLSIK